MLIDSHVNLHAEAFQNDLDDVLTRAREAGVAIMVAICDRLQNASIVAAIAEEARGVYATIGAHPHHAKDKPDLRADELISLAGRSAKICAIGETGLDRHYGYSPIEDQIASLRAHIKAARALDLPIVIHTREADDLTAQILEQAYAEAPFRILMHCYTSGPELARRALALGATFSLSGILTFKTAHDVRAIAAELPLDRIILETDCPYLAPVPHRGRRNEPAFVADVYRYFAAFRGLEEAKARALVADNFFKLFHTVSRP